MTKTVPLEWYKDRDGDDALFAGRKFFGVIVSDRFDLSGNYRVLPTFHTSMQLSYPTREAAIAALEEAVMALRAKVE